MPLPERGVPEGSEDLQAVVECVPELEQTPEHKPREILQCQSPDSPPLKAKPFLSKSLDGNKQTQCVKKFVHNVDEQLRRKNDEPSSSTEMSPMEGKPHNLRRQEEFDKETAAVVASSSSSATPSAATSTQSEFRSKFIINCESTVFEHTGVSYETSEPQLTQSSQHSSVASLLERDTPIAQPASQIRSSFMGAPLAKTFSNFFRSFKDTSGNSTPVQKELEQKQQAVSDNYLGEQGNCFYD